MARRAASVMCANSWSDIHSEWDSNSRHDVGRQAERVEAGRGPIGVDLGEKALFHLGL